MRSTTKSRRSPWSASTIQAALPPNSSTTFFLPARAFRSQPTAGEPVNESSLKRSSVVNRSAPSRCAGRIENAPCGQIGFGQHLADDQRSNGRATGRLEHEGTADRQRRRDLVRGQVQREIERRDEGTWPDRHALAESAIAFRSRRDFQIHDLAIDAHGFLGGDLERVDQARGFAARILDGFAGLDAQRHREFVEALAKALNAMFEDRLALERRHLAARFLRAHRCGDAGIDRLRIRQRHARGHLARVLVGDFQIGVRRDRFVGEVVGVGGFEHDEAPFRKQQTVKCKRRACRL